MVNFQKVLCCGRWPFASSLIVGKSPGKKTKQYYPDLWNTLTHGKILCPEKQTNKAECNGNNPDVHISWTLFLQPPSARVSTIDWACGSFIRSGFCCLSVCEHDLGANVHNVLTNTNKSETWREGPSRNDSFLLLLKSRPVRQLLPVSSGGNSACSRRITES